MCRFSCMPVRLMNSISWRSLTVSCASCETWFGWAWAARQNVPWRSSNSSLSRIPRSSISFPSDVNPINIFTVSMISIYFWRSDFIILIVNIRYSDTSIVVILFGPANPILSLILNMRQSQICRTTRYTRGG